MPAEPQDITKFPDVVFNLVDDDARALLVSVGLYGRFEHAAEVTFPEPGVAISYHAAHPTHWLMATFTCRFPDAKENGYAVQCLPKSGFPRDRALSVFNYATQQLAPGEHAVFIERHLGESN